MRTIAVVISVAALGVIAAACGGERSAVTSTAAPTITPTPVPAIATAAQPRALTGTITFDGDPAIPAGAVLTVEVRDVSLQDVASVLIASQTIENPDRFPIEFSVPYDPGDIDTRSDYGMQITISLNDQLIYTNDTAFYVITKGNPNSDVETWVVAVAQPRALTGTITFDGDPAIPAGAVLTVEVRDVSLQDVASVLIASQTIENPDRFPIEFSVPYDPGDIDTRSDYGMQITISLNDQLIYTNDTAFYVITKGNPNSDVETWVVAVGGG